MFPDAPQASTSANLSKSGNENPYDVLLRSFVGETRSQLATLTGEIAQRNKVIMGNDSYVYGDLLQRSLKVPVGHDFTPVNWLRRVAEIHRTETMGDGFRVTTSYHGVDVDSAFDPSAKGQLQLINNKKKTYAEKRNQLIDAMIRDNGGMATFARMVENASVVGDTVVKAWVEDDGTGKLAKYRYEMIEFLEHFYAVWSQDNFREFDFCAYVYQISKQEAVQRYGVPEDIATSPLGMPLAVLSSANTINYMSTQPMVTVMEVNGRIQGWGTENTKIVRKPVGKENIFNAVIVGDRVFRVIDDPKYLPKFYIFPNKLIRRRPWGLADITDAAININQTYIETLSDWRTVASKINFPKWKAFGFGLDTPMPKPKPRTAEILPLGEGQDIKPLGTNLPEANVMDFQRQMAELKEAFVRETGISQAMFEMPDTPALPTRAAASLSTQSLSDQVRARRQLWEPIIKQMFQDAFDTLALWDTGIKELVQGDDDWYMRVSWPPMMRKDDPSYVTMVLNQSIAGYQSIQTLFERLGLNAKEEIDRINDEMNDPLTAAMHGKMMNLLAEFKIAGPPTSAPPKINVNLRGDITPQQETNLSMQHGFGDGPVFGPSVGPQGEQGLRAIDDLQAEGMVTGKTYNTGLPQTAGGQQVGGGQLSSVSDINGASGGNTQPQSPQILTPPSGNQPGEQVMSQPGTSATPNSPQGNINQQAQRRGRK